MESIWENSARSNSFRPLRGDIRTDVLVIGGGMAGVLCAYFLKQAGVKYALAEGGRIGQGITKNTTAKITSQHGLIYHKLTKTAGREKAAKYLLANQLALAKFKALSADIPCDFEEKSAFVYSRTNRRVIEKEVSAVQRLGLEAGFASSIPLPIKVAGAIGFPDQAQFNPLKFLAGIARDLHIYENTYVKEMIGNTAVTENGKIQAEKVIVATHFPFLNKHGSYFLKLYQHRSYAIALESAPDPGGMYLEETKDGMSFRTYQDKLIIGGGDHKTGKQGGNWQVLRDFAREFYPDAQERFHWATQDCMSLDGVPYIGKYSARTDRLFVATGFNKWGMSSAMAAAQILADLVCGKPNDYAEVFSPSRSILKPRLFVNGCAAVGNLLTPSAKRCPHLGCALKWNDLERTWDCPCHGSRFKEDGALIDNPATGGLKIG